MADRWRENSASREGLEKDASRDSSETSVVLVRNERSLREAHWPIAFNAIPRLRAPQIPEFLEDFQRKIWTHFLSLNRVLYSELKDLSFTL